MPRRDRDLLIQLATPAGTPAGWLRFDLFAGDSFPPGVKVNAAAFQGHVFEGMDRLVAWTEGDDLVLAVLYEDAPTWLGKRWARIYRFPPLAPDPAFAGAYNTRASQTIYAEGESVQLLEEWNDQVLPYADLPALVGEELEGQLLANDQFAAHRTARAQLDWREWTFGIPEEELEDDRVRPQRPLGRYVVPDGTRTYFFRTTAEPNDLHSGDFENAMIRDQPGTSLLQTVSGIGQNGKIAWVFTTQAGEPALVSWPAGTYRAQLDVPAAGVDIVYAFRTLGTNVGHFGRTGLLVHTDTAQPTDQFVFQGAGLKMTTLVKAWADGQTTDRFDVALAALRNTGMGNQSMSLRFSADCFADGPWPSGNAQGPKLRIGDVVAVAGRQSETAELAPFRQSSDTELP